MARDFMDEHYKSENKWMLLTLLLAIFGFLKNISPESPYIAEFLVGERFNFTKIQLTQDIFPVSTYASTVQTLIVLLITDILRYKPVIVVGALGFIAHKSLLVWGRTILEIQANQFFLGTSKACTLAYKTYIYSIVDRAHYQQVTAIIRIAPKMGTLFSSIFSQISRSVFQFKIELLNRISLSASLMTFLCALLLPSLKHGIVFNKDKLPQHQNVNAEKPGTCSSTFQFLWREFKDAYTNPYVIKWCFWWILATGAFQVVTDHYVQILWKEISADKEPKFNAGVEAMYTIVSGLCCCLIGMIQVNWQLRGEVVLTVVTLLEGMLLIYSATTHSILISYAVYIAFGTLYDMMMVISNSEVARHLKNESFALIFGINSFLSLSFQSLLTHLLVSKHVFALSIREQFVGVGRVFLALGVFYGIKAIISLFSTSNKAVQDENVNTITHIVPTLKTEKGQPDPSPNGVLP